MRGSEDAGKKMNDFTKEELEFIQDGIRHWSNQNIPTEWVFDFKDKIQSMIENYHECNMEYCGYVEATQCDHCGKRE